MTNEIQYFLEQVLKDVDISDSEKKVIVAGFLVQYYKSFLECLMALNTHNEDFFKEMITFLDKGIAGLDEKKKINLDTVMNEEKKRILADILLNIQKELSPEQSSKIQNNLEKLAQTP